MREKLDTSFHNSRKLLANIDALPKGPGWSCDLLTVIGDLKDAEGNLLLEVLELWRRNPKECAQELAGKSLIKDMQYAPFESFVDAAGTEERIDESWTGKAWRDMQEKLPEGATVVPIILGSDKTQLSVFTGDKSAWPVYLTIGNIPKAERRCSSKRTQSHLGYLPVSKLKIFLNDKKRKIEVYRLFHRCMRILLGPLYKAGIEPTDIVCADSMIRECYLLLIGNVCDHPEQCLIGCCQENYCPTCDVQPTERGNSVPGSVKDTEDLARILRDQGKDLNPQEFKDLGLRSIPKPYWAGLPHCDIGKSFAPDLLHQMYKGVFKEHLVSWCTTAVAEGPAGEREIDSRFNKLPNHAGARHFKNGISVVSQWTGHEAKEMAKVFYGILLGAVDSGVAAAAKAILDFMTYARLQVHTTTTLQAMQQALEDFHRHKEVFIEKGIRDQFDIPKVHSLLHYIEKIRWLGTTDGFNTEATERLHIDLAKEAYRASNKRDYHAQMTKYLARRESLDKFSEFLNWKHDRDEERTKRRRKKPRRRRSKRRSDDSDEDDGSDDSNCDGGSSESSDGSDDGDINPAATATGLGKRKRVEDDGGEASVGSNAAPPVSASVQTPVQYKISKVPQRNDKLVSTDTIKQRHQATDFLPELYKYITASITQNIRNPDQLVPMRFDIFRCFSVILPRLYHMPEEDDNKRKDRIRARPAVDAQGRAGAKPSQFDTVLVRTVSASSPPGSVGEILDLKGAH